MDPPVLQPWVCIINIICSISLASLRRANWNRIINTPLRSDIISPQMSVALCVCVCVWCYPSLFWTGWFVIECLKHLVVVRKVCSVNTLRGGGEWFIREISPSEKQPSAVVRTENGMFLSIPPVCREAVRCCFWPRGLWRTCELTHFFKDRKCWKT